MQAIPIANDAFKKQARKAVYALITFFFIYLSLIFAALVLTIVCIGGGIALFLSIPSGITFFLGLAFASIGVLVLVFLLKFLFAKAKNSRSHLVEISAKDEPALFELINQIVTQVGTTFPKRVYLSAEVNASVFYDSTFWSMFFPVKKNLVIGIGLVKGLTVEEFRAVLAHEFGHFSQKSMKVGSYVYNVNQVLHNLLYENEGYDNIIQNFSVQSGFFALAARIAEFFIEGIQKELKRVYEYVNKNYMGLSREMEFHADAIAASIAGSNPAKNALLRIELANAALDNVFNFYNTRIEKCEISDNIFTNQEFVIGHLGKELNLPLKNDLPILQVADLDRFNFSKLVIKDQWASHPSLQDRITHLDKLNISTDFHSSEPALSIFKDGSQTEKRLNEHVFKQITYSGETKAIPHNHFIESYLEDIKKNSFPKIFNGYYDRKSILPFDLKEVTTSHVNGSTSSDLFADEWVRLANEAAGLQDDIAVLDQIKANPTNVPTFDYDGKKYKHTEIDALKVSMQEELKLKEEKILAHDQLIYATCLVMAQTADIRDEISLLYTNHFTFFKSIDDRFGIQQKMYESLQFVQQQTQFDTIRANFKRLEPTEKEFKDRLLELMAHPLLVPVLNDEQKEQLRKYFTPNLLYFKGNMYINSNLELLYYALSTYSFLLLQLNFLHKKVMLDAQAKILL